MGRRVVSGFRLASIVCHALCLLLLLFIVVDCVRAASSASAEVSDISSFVAPEDVDSSSVAESKSLSIPNLIVTLAKRLWQISQEGTGRDKLPYVVEDGLPVRYIPVGVPTVDPGTQFKGLGKREQVVVDPGSRFKGLAKREQVVVDPAFQMIGLGKREQVVVDPGFQMIGLAKREQHDTGLQHSGHLDEN